jgi:hypothetical protein
VALALRVWSVCAVAALCAGAGHAAAQTVEPLRPSLADEDVAAINPAPTVPRLTISPEDEAIPPPIKRKTIVDAYAPLGIVRGGVTYFPSLGVDVVGSSNGAQTATNAKAAAGLRLRPSLRFESDWVRHSWQGQASGDFTRYLGRTATDNMQADASTKFRLDIHHDMRGEFEAGYRLAQDGASDSEVPDTAIGNRTDHTLRASAAFVDDYGPLESRLKLGIERRIFEDVKLSGGGTEDNADRNTYSPSVGVRLAYIDPPVLKPFIDLTYEPRFHDQKLDRNGLRRDSQGVTTSLGVALDHGPIWSGEMALVYAIRDYRDEALKTNSAFGVNGNLTWSPTELTSVLLTLETTLDETEIATSSGSRTYSGRLDLTHALRDNVDVLAGMGVSVNANGGSTDTTITSKLGMAWQLTPELAWTASYDGTWFRAAQASDRYNEQRISTGFVLRR